MDGKEAGRLKGEHVFRFEVPISGVHRIKASVSGTDITEEMEIAKVSEPNPIYFASKDKVKNWFDEHSEEEADNGYLSINSTMGEIQAVPEGAAIIERIMESMKRSTAGGMGADVKISPAMQAMVARQPLKKLLQQGGMDIGSEDVTRLNEALSRIKKN